MNAEKKYALLHFCVYTHEYKFITDYETSKRMVCKIKTFILEYDILFGIYLTQNLIPTLYY